jgi:hypothetical protein
MSFNQFWKKYKFSMAVALSVLFILIIWLTKAVMRCSSFESYIPSTFDFVNDFDINDYIPNNIPHPVVVQPTAPPRPTSSKGEDTCRKVFESIYKRPFTKCRPPFLLNVVTGSKHALELDGYNEDLKIAFEYNGEQHYKYIPYFHKTKDSFYNQKYRDEMKRRLCMEHNVHLIEVPYHVSNIRAFISEQLSEKKLL